MGLKLAQSPGDMSFSSKITAKEVETAAMIGHSDYDIRFPDPANEGANQGTKTFSGSNFYATRQ